MTNKFDFIVVGGGAAGSVIASGLAKSRKHPSVLLLETGGRGLDETDRHPYNRFMNAFVLPQIDHGYETVPQKGLGGRVVSYQRGKGLGGSTLLNFMVYTKGPSVDWDRWAALVDDKDWSWEKIKQRYRRIETIHDSIDPKYSRFVDLDPSNHGYNGPLHVSLPGNDVEDFVHINMEAGLEAGLPLNGDINSGNVIGVAIANISIGSGERSTAEKAFLTNLPENLTIWTDSQVSKVIMEGDTAIGIQTVHGKSAYATNEVILSAGGIDTPKLLLLSGIGPRDELQKLGIDVVHDLAGVGKNASDHLSVIICDMMGPEFSKRSRFDNDKEAHPSALKMWVESKKGPFATQNKDSVIMFGKDPIIETARGFQELDEEQRKYLTNPAVPNWEVITGGPLIPPTFLIPPGRNYTSHVTVQMNPQSTGSVTLRSSDPLDKPLIDPNYLENPYDLQCLTAAVRFERKFMATKAMQHHYKMPIFAPASDSDEDIHAFIQASAGPLFHFSSTAKMGKSSDRLAVTDSDFRVFGIKKLRAADISICPFNPNAHTQAPAYVIGQTAVDKLVAEYGLDVE